MRRATPEQVTEQVGRRIAELRVRGELQVLVELVPIPPPRGRLVLDDDVVVVLPDDEVDHAAELLVEHLAGVRVVKLHPAERQLDRDHGHRPRREDVPVEGRQHPHPDVDRVGGVVIELDGHGALALECPGVAEHLQHRLHRRDLGSFVDRRVHGPHRRVRRRPEGQRHRHERGLDPEHAMQLVPPRADRELLELRDRDGQPVLVRRRHVSRPPARRDRSSRPAARRSGCSPGPWTGRRAPRRTACARAP